MRMASDLESELIEYASCIPSSPFKPPLIPSMLLIILTSQSSDPIINFPHFDFNPTYYTQ